MLFPCSPEDDDVIQVGKAGFPERRASMRCANVVGVLQKPKGRTENSYSWSLLVEKAIFSWWLGCMGT